MYTPGKAKKPTTLMPMAMWSSAVMPPPASLEKELGEQRITNFTGVAISLCAPVDPAQDVPQGSTLSDTIFAAVCDEYKHTDRTIRLGERPPAHFTQPFLEGQETRQEQRLGGGAEPEKDSRDKGQKDVVDPSGGLADQRRYDW